MTQQPRRTVNVQARAGEERRAATRARILDGAKTLLAAGAPLAVMTVAKVAEAAGVSRATFYLHFPDKRELIDELARDLLAQWTPISGPMLADPAPARSDVFEAVRAVVATWRLHTGVLAGLIEVAEYDDDARRSWRAAIDGIATTIAAWLALVRPDLDAPRAQLLAQVLAWSGERSLHQLLSDDPAADARLVEALTELVWSVRHVPGAA